MARHEQNTSPGAGPFLDCLLAFGLVWLAWPLLNARVSPSASATAWLALVAAEVLGGFLTVRLIRRILARHLFHRKINRIVARHLDSLIRRRSQLVRPDAYGKPRLEKWEKEVDYFIDHHIEPALTARERAMLERGYDAVARVIAGRVEDEAGGESGLDGFSEDMTPTEFEIFCAEELQRAGWEAGVTMQGRDQGVDVIAEKNGMRVVLQCKLYSRPVGNKSVQEAAAGRAHEKAHRGAVVTNNSYTPSAEQLAATNGILLLHYRDLENLETLLAHQGRPPPASSAASSLGGREKSRPRPA